MLRLSRIASIVLQALAIHLHATAATPHAETLLELSDKGFGSAHLVASYDPGTPLLGETGRSDRVAHGEYVEQLLNFESKFTGALSAVHFESLQACRAERCPGSSQLRSSAMLQDTEADPSHSLGQARRSFFMEVGASPCDWPAGTQDFSLITRDNANVSADIIYSGIAIGGNFIDGTPFECGDVYGQSYITGELEGLRWNFTAGITIGKPFTSVFYWPHFEWLARELEAGDYPGGYRITVLTSGGTYSTESFWDPDLDSDMTPSGEKFLAVFNTDEDVTLDMSFGSKPFLPSVLAPFSHVTLLARAEYAQGIIIAKTFGGPVIEMTGSDDNKLEMHGQVYGGSMMCGGVWTNPPTSAPTTTTTTTCEACDMEGGTTVNGCRCMKTWMHGGENKTCCAETSDRDAPWCYIVDGSTCLGATKAVDGSGFWDECPSSASGVGLSTTKPTGQPAEAPSSSSKTSTTSREDSSATQSAAVPTAGSARAAPSTSSLRRGSEPSLTTMRSTTVPAKPSPAEPDVTVRQTGSNTPSTTSAPMKVTVEGAATTMSAPGESSDTITTTAAARSATAPLNPDDSFTANGTDAIVNASTTPSPGPSSMRTRSGTTVATSSVEDAVSTTLSTTAALAPSSAANTTAVPLSYYDLKCYANLSEHGCRCQDTWLYGGEFKQCCQYTPDHDKPWCYVVDGVNCPNSIKTSGEGGYWDNCAPYTPTTTTTTAACISNITEHNCHCMQTWLYAGNEMHCCQNTPDNDLPWCYVVDGADCPGAIKTSGDGGYWDNCAPYAPTTTTTTGVCISNMTEHNCHCMQTWLYAGNEMHCCQTTPDNDLPWCYVSDGADCPGAIKTSGDGGYWDNCAPYAPTTTTTTGVCISNITEHNCHCMQTWLYSGNEMHCCQTTPDNDLPWCYVSDGADCPGAIKTSGDGGYWDNCAPYASTTTTTTGECSISNMTEHHCHCMHTWRYSGKDRHCCETTPDHDLPWCYVSDGADCPGAIKTSGDGGYWDNCANRNAI